MFRGAASLHGDESLIGRSLHLHARLLETDAAHDGRLAISTLKLPVALQALSSEVDNGGYVAKLVMSSKRICMA